MILKLNSTGELVEKLQRMLNIKVDGVFGHNTKSAVEAFQLENGLVVDGIVGQKTWSKMLDKYEPNSFVTENDLIINRHYLSENQYFNGSVPRYVFIHHTAGWHNPYNTINDWNNDTRGNVATEFVLGGQSIRGDESRYDGELVKCLPRGGWGWHLGTGRNDVHKNSVGIEVNNFGYLSKGGYYKSINGKRTWIEKDKDKLYTYVGIEAASDQIVELKSPFRGYKFWHKYSNKQIETLKKWLYYIGERDNIDIREGLPSLIKIKGADAFKYISDVRYGKIKGGVWSHTNVRRDKFDMFPQDELLDMLMSL